MTHLTNFSFAFFYEIFTEDASLLLLYHGAKKSKMTKNSNQGGGPALNTENFRERLSLGFRVLTCSCTTISTTKFECVFDVHLVLHTDLLLVCFSFLFLFDLSLSLYSDNPVKGGWADSLRLSLMLSVWVGQVWGSLFFFFCTRRTPQ